MVSAATGQPPPDDPHRLGVPIMPRPGHRPEHHRQCLKCRFFKPLQDFEAWRKKGRHVLRCVACRKEMQSSSRALQVSQGIRGVSGTKRGSKRSVGEVDGPQKPWRYVPIAAKPPQPSPESPQVHCTPTPRYVPFAAQPSRALPISHIAPFQTSKPQKQGTLHRAILPRNVTAAGHASQGSSVFQGRGTRSQDTPVMHPARQDRGFTSRAQPFEARDGSAPSPSQKITTARQDGMTAGPKTTTARQDATTAGPKATTAGPKATTAGPKATTAGPKATTAGPKATTVGHDARTARAIHHLSREHEEKFLANGRIKTEK
ncbi:hypothetical protein E4U24_003268 [Claviceps purpurea]|nr:hypothetical protein E4U24_003268 [Claviceps purpurea]